MSSLIRLSVVCSSVVCLSVCLSVVCYGTFTHTLRCAAIVLRCASSALRYRCTIAGAAQRSDNYLDYLSAAQRMCERIISLYITLLHLMQRF